MKIVRFETFLANSGLRNYLFIRLTTDTGLTGIGEASLEWQEKTVETICHEWLAERMIGRDPFGERHSIWHFSLCGPSVDVAELGRFEDQL